MSWGRRVYERTCDECGTAWKVPKVIAKPPRRPLRSNAVTAGINYSNALPGVGGGIPDIQGWDAINRVERNLPSNWSAQRAAEDLGKCPQCGSEEYSQRPFRP